MTQKENILKLIEKAGEKGISTNELRNITHAVDVPKCVSDLKKEGHPIDSTENGDGTVTYYMALQPIREWQQLPNGNYDWIIKGYKHIAEPKSKKGKVSIDLSQYDAVDSLGNHFNPITWEKVNL